MQRRAQTASVPLPKKLLSQFSATSKRCTRDTTVVAQRRSDTFDATFSKFSRRRDGARDATCGKSNSAESQPSSFCVPVQHPMSSASNTPAISFIHVAPRILFAGRAHIPTQVDESDRESAVDAQSDDPFQFDDPLVTAPVILLQRNSGTDHRDDLPHHIRGTAQTESNSQACPKSGTRCKTFTSGCWQTDSFDLMWSHDV